MATVLKPKKHFWSTLFLITCLIIVGTILAEPRFFYSVRDDLKSLVQNNQAKKVSKGTKKGEDSEAIAACQEYIKEVNEAIQKYAKDHPSKKYPWRDYNDMIDADDPSLVPQYLTVVRGCPEGGVYSYDLASHSIKCSFPKHNP